MKVMVGAPVRNRAWVLPRFIEAIKKQDIPFETCFIVNDCVDNTKELLDQAGFTTVLHNLNSNHGHVRGEYSLRNLALLRNVLLDKFLESDCNYLFSIDTDVIIPEGSIRKLVEADKDIISMLIRNHPTFMAHNILINNEHLPQIPEGIISIDVTGAVYLIKRHVIEQGVRYDYSPLGEDIPFCEEAKRKGFGIYCDTRLKPIHAYGEGVDLLAVTTHDHLSGYS